MKIVVDIRANIVYYTTILVVTFIVRHSVLMVLTKKSWFFLHNYVINFQYEIMLCVFAWRENSVWRASNCLRASGSTSWRNPSVVGDGDDLGELVSEFCTTKDIRFMVFPYQMGRWEEVRAVLPFVKLSYSIGINIHWVPSWTQFRVKITQILNSIVNRCFDVNAKRIKK